MADKTTEYKIENPELVTTGDGIDKQDIIIKLLQKIEVNTRK